MVPRPRLMTGGEAVAEAMCQVDPDVIPIYPITPQTPIIETFANLVAEGRATGELIHVESEHSAMSAAVGASLAGARTFTATASQGLALMIEIVYIAASMRAPIVMAVGNRALSGPINIHCDHSDSMLARDSGAIQIFVESAQDAYDFMIMAPRIAEHPEVLLPVMICLDGFTITHGAEPVLTIPYEDVSRFVGPYVIPHPLLRLDEPTTQGPFAMHDCYFELKYQQVHAMDRALEVFDEIVEEYAQLTGRGYGAVESYRIDDAESVIVVMGSTVGTIKDVVDQLRQEGQAVGVLAIRSFRPFPHAQLRIALAGVGAVATLERAVSPGGYPPLFQEVSVALGMLSTPVRPYVFGLGGRDLDMHQIADVYSDLSSPACTDAVVYLGLRH
ncbi:MAG: pyruvate ferredoxin oxidoreductase [Bradymonadaceae bacterium]